MNFTFIAQLRKKLPKKLNREAFIAFVGGQAAPASKRDDEGDSSKADPNLAALPIEVPVLPSRYEEYKFIDDQEAFFYIYLSFQF